MWVYNNIIHYCNISLVFIAILSITGIDKEDGCIVETPGRHIAYVSGTAILDNHSVNLLSSLLTCVVTSQFSLHLWGLLIRP